MTAGKSTVGFARFACAACCILVAAAAAAMPTLPEIGFELTLRQAVTNSPQSKVTSSEMKSFRVDEKDGRTSLVWRGHPLCGDGFTVTAELTPTPEKDGWAYSFRYAGNESGLHIRDIWFPAVTVARTDTTELFLPRDCGMIRRPDWKKAKGGADVGKNGIHGIHFMAALNGTGESWYMDQRGDARLHMNRFLVRNGTKPHTLTMLFHYTAQLTDGNRVAGEMPFGGTIRTFRGDWFAAADIYRRWAWEQPWARVAFARRQDKLRNIAIWFWNRGLSDEVAPPVERFQELTGLPVALDWYWWHAIPYDAGYPFFWPPREGEEQFTATVRRLVDKGIFVQPYMNGISWDVKGPKWQEQGSREAVVSAAGKTGGRQYNIYVPSGLTTMCGTAKNFQTHMRGLVRKLRECGLSGVYLDQIGGWRTVVCECWSPTHPHPPGGGAMMTEGYRAFLRQIKADNPGFPISTEYTPEAYLDIVDSAIILYQNGECFGMSAMPEEETVPAFQAVYHGAITLYGSYAVIDGIPPWDPKWPPECRWKKEKAWEKLYPDQFALEFARGVAMGMQPMVHCLRMTHIDDPRYAADFAFTVDTAKFYHANLDYLYDGTMCAPGTLTCEKQPVEILARGIYTTKKKARVVRHPAVPTILHSVWRKKDGRVAAVLCNWSRKEQRYDLATPDIVASGVIPARSWRLIEK